MECGTGQDSLWLDCDTPAALGQCFMLQCGQVGGDRDAIDAAAHSVERSAQRPTAANISTWVPAKSTKEDSGTGHC